MSFGDLKVQDLIYEDASNNEITVVIADLATKANPVFSGTVTVPTATAGDNSTKAASTAFVVASFAPKNAPVFTGSATGVNLTLSGDLTVNGTTTTINTTTLQVEDKNIEIGKVSSPSDTTADGGGITLLASSNKTILWTNATDTWDFNQSVNIASGLDFKVNNVSVLNATALGGSVVGSSLTSVGTLTSLTVTGNLVVDTNTLFVNAANNRVGLGTTSPGWDLTLEKAGTASMRIGNTSNSVLVDVRATASEGLIRTASNHVLQLATNQVTRFQVGTSGQLGIGGATYGSSGQVLTSGGSGAAPSWANPAAGGNTFTAVADGAIATDKLVKIKTNGKVEQIAQVVSASSNIADSNSYATASGSADAGSGSWLIYDPDQHRVVSFYTAAYADNNMRYSVMSIISDGRANQGPISGSSDLGVESTARVNGSYEWGSVCYDTNNNKYILGLRCRNDDNVYVGAGTYDTSDDSITWPSGKSNWTQPNGTNNNARIPTLYFDETTNRIVLLMRDDSNSDRPYVVIGTYNSSSGSIDWGTKQVLDTTDIRDNNTVVCKGGNGTGEVFVGYKSSTTALTGNLITVSNSSNTCTIQTAVTIQTNASEFRADYNAQDQNIILAYGDTNDNYKGKLIRLTKNSGGTGFDKSSAYTFCVNNQSSRWDVHYFSSAKKCYVFYRVSASDRTVKAFMVNNTSGTPSQNTTVNGSGGLYLGDVWIGHTASSNQNLITDKIFEAVPNNSRSNRVNIEGWSALTSSSNIGTSTKHQYVGFTDQAYSDGQTATIITYGNVKSGLSGLTIGSKYYVSATGTLGTTDNSLGNAGVALAADKLLIKEPV